MEPINRVFTIGMSDAFSVGQSYRSEVTQHKINFVKNCPQWGLNCQPPDHQSNVLPDDLSHYLSLEKNSPTC